MTMKDASSYVFDQNGTVPDMEYKHSDLWIMYFSNPGTGPKSRILASGSGLQNSKEAFPTNF